MNSNPFFSAAVAHMAATADGDGRALARVHNFRFDPRVGGLREQNYYENLALENDSPEHLEERHNRYVREKVWTPSCPETFMSENCAAFLDKMDDAQDLIRLVNVDTLLVLVDSDQGCNGKDKAFNLLKEKLLLAQKGIKEAVALIEVWVDQWNQKQHDGPRFSAPKKHIQPLVDAANWTELLRDRLGLAGFDSSRTPYVALMGYTVGEVRRAARKKHIDTPFAVPTVLDLPVSEYFFPAPLAPFPGETQSFGRTMA
ncbi:MAG TPA: hypothetical protein HPQ00_11805, partial [Magnetococcales bacterium]|nr:hypothetical protein [Magnetococcales bacterium]